MHRLASWLAVLAVLGVVGATTAVLAAYRARDMPTAPWGPGHVSHGGLLVRGEGVGGSSVEVPGRGWTLEPRETTIYYVDPAGDPVVGVSGPAVYRNGYCPGARGSSQRAFAGFTGTSDPSAWVEAISLAEDLRSSNDHTPVETRARTLADGTPAIRSSSTITLADPGDCHPPRVQFTMLSWHTGDGRANLVLVRDVGTPGALTDESAEAILGSAR